MPRLSKEVEAERIAQIKAFKSQGLTQCDMAARLGISQPSVHSFMARHGLTKKATGELLRRIRNRTTGEELADPSNLTPEQLDIARRTGISPARFAWLCTCPKDGSDRKGARP